MLDVVLVLVVLLMSAATLLYSIACQKLWQNDLTRDASTDELIGAPKA